MLIQKAQIRVYIVGVNGALVRRLANRATWNHIVHVVCYVIPSYIHVVTIQNVQKISRILSTQSHAISTYVQNHSAHIKSGRGVSIGTRFSVKKEVATECAYCLATINSLKSTQPN
uniref:Uncharacterized protein n=1 Tax=Parascaris univalens TaxID=6257 RepID=A0A915AWI6_PARUN